MCVLTRDAAIPTLANVVVALVTTRVRGLPSEVLLGPEDGLPRPCVISLDNPYPRRSSSNQSRRSHPKSSPRSVAPYAAPPTAEKGAAHMQTCVDAQGVAHPATMRWPCKRERGGLIPRLSPRGSRSDCINLECTCAPWATASPGPLKASVPVGRQVANRGRQSSDVGRPAPLALDITARREWQAHEPERVVAVPQPLELQLHRSTADPCRVQEDGDVGGPSSKGRQVAVGEQLVAVRRRWRATGAELVLGVSHHNSPA